MFFLVAVAVAASGCAKSPSIIRARISVDDNVPPLYILRSRLVRPAAPTEVAVTSRLSQAIGDATDRPGPYHFPLVLDVGVPPGWSGDVDVTIEALSWDVADAVVASGAASTKVSPETQVEATLILQATPGGGGGIDGGTTEAGPPEDASGD
ncbi:MAG: hypothetical protein ABUS79_11710 [Pseudomonadota bacterium]